MVSLREKIFIIAFLLCFYLVKVSQRYQPYTFLTCDSAFYAQINRGIFKSLTLRQEEFHPASWYEGKLGWNRNLSDSWSNISLGKNGEWYPKHSFLMPIFSTPFYAVFGSAGLLIFNLFSLVAALYFAYLFARRFFDALPSLYCQTRTKSFVFAIHFHTAKKPDTLSSSLESLKVFLSETPCDYFNMAHDRWECSHMDRGLENFTGRASAANCGRHGAGMLYIFTFDSESLDFVFPSAGREGIYVYFDVGG